MNLRELLDLIQKIAQDGSISAPFITGGVPRDKLLNKLSNIEDIDLTTGDQSVHKLAEAVAKSLPEADYKILKDGHAQIIVNGLKVDFSSNFVSPQAESLLEKAGAEATSMMEELYSRDFTVNALLMELDLETIKDPTGLGLNDIKAKRIRTCLPAKYTLANDNKRVVRAIYLAAKLGFEIDEEIINWVKENPAMFSSGIAPQYLTKTIQKAVNYDKEKTVKYINELGLWSQVPVIDELVPYIKKAHDIRILRIAMENIELDLGIDKVAKLKKKDKKRIDLDTRPYPSPFFTNYDYTAKGPSKSSPGGSPFFGTPGGGEKSMGDWIKKRRKANKKRQKKLESLLHTSDLLSLAKLFEPNKEIYEDLKLALNTAVKKYYISELTKIRPEIVKDSEQANIKLQNDKTVDNIEKACISTIEKIFNNTSKQLDGFLNSNNNIITLNNKLVVDELFNYIDNQQVNVLADDQIKNYITDSFAGYASFTIEKIDNNLLKSIGGIYEVDEFKSYLNYPLEVGPGDDIRRITDLMQSFVNEQYEKIIYRPEYIDDLLDLLNKLPGNKNLTNYSDEVFFYDTKVDQFNDLLLEINFTGLDIDPEFKTEHSGTYHKQNNNNHVITLYFKPFNKENIEKLFDVASMSRPDLLLRNKYKTLWHELVHLEQDKKHDEPKHVIRGLPPKDKTKSKQYDYDGVDKKTNRRTEEHAFRDIEAYPRLNDEVNRFKEKIEQLNKDAEWYKWSDEKRKQEKRNFLNKFLTGEGYLFYELLRRPTSLQESDVKSKNIPEDSPNINRQPNLEDNPNRERYKQMVKKFLLWLQQNPELME